MHRAWITILMVATGALGSMLTGCGPAESGQTGPANKPSELRLGYFANLTHAQALLGVESGAFAQAIAPTQLTTRVFNAGPSLVEALFAGEIDIGYIGPGPAIMAHSRSRGQGVRVVAGAAANGALIVARKGAGIQSLADLKGKRIATPQIGNTQDISARHFVMAVLKQQDARNVVPVANAEQAAMMARDEIDAAWSPEPWGSRLVAEADGVVIAHEKDIQELWPDGQMALTLVITTREFLRDHPDLLAKMLKVHAQLTDRLQKEPQQCALELDAALERLTGKRLPAGVALSAIRNVRFTTDPLEQTLETMANWSYELGLARDPVTVAGLVDLSVLKQTALEKSE